MVNTVHTTCLMTRPSLTTNSNRGVRIHNILLYAKIYAVNNLHWMWAPSLTWLCDNILQVSQLYTTTFKALLLMYAVTHIYTRHSVQTLLQLLEFNFQHLKEYFEMENWHSFFFPKTYFPSRSEHSNWQPCTDVTPSIYCSFVFKQSLYINMRGSHCKLASYHRHS